MPKHSKLTLEDLLSEGPSEKVRQKLLEEETRLKRQKPSRWTIIYRRGALLRAKAKGELSEKELTRALSKYYKERRKIREKLEKESRGA
ncbi:MAG: hypothetical protein ACTSV7_14040 [Candidatus Baldrarchaeia archaeon]